MDMQGALVLAFNIPGVVADALTATLITLGRRLAQGIGHPGPESQEWRWSSMFLVLLCLIYGSKCVRCRPYLGFHADASCSGDRRDHRNFRLTFSISVRDTWHN